MRQLDINGVPCWVCSNTLMQEASQRGVILFFHGLNSNATENKKELTSLADDGFLVIGVDAVGHGKRRYPDLDQRINEFDFMETFNTIIHETTAEIPIILEGLSKLRCNVEKIGITGISMGGYITFGACQRYDFIKAAAPILGSPNWYSENSPHQFPQDYYPVPLLVQNASKDQSVSPVHARKFCEALSPYYKETPERLIYREYPESGHFMIEPEWNTLWEQTREWFKNYL
jgi:pimeloyl-ACP methyl ester carboxylesterase